MMSALGVTAGAHRLWSHRSYKAKLPLKMFLAVSNTMAFQVNILYDHFAENLKMEYLLQQNKSENLGSIPPSP